MLPNFKVSADLLVVLIWLREGRSAFEIGLIEGVTVDLIIERLARVSEQLRASSTEEAVQKAVRLRII